MNSVDGLLRAAPQTTPRARTALALGLGGGALMGGALGAYSGEPLMAVFAAIKVPLLLLLSAGLCLPSFYVLNAVLGLRADLAPALRALLAAQAALGVTLGALTPISVFASLSVHDPYAQTLVDGMLFAVATFAAQQMLARHYEPLVARDPRHLVALRGWLVVYVFTGIQLAWVLRPFRGTAGFPVEFLRPEAFEQNAYLVVLDHFARLLR
ncbi:MAG: hypothetical protein H6838_03245 [Planctomycetes bacterium]|nr:hypothetical protein [Planctomycetota bacterium]MCB9884478.1 hypothetical protein [Planctomycetota bacterium]